jgi:hypothetical protein
MPKPDVPLGTEIVTAFDEIVAALNDPEPTCVATAVGVTPLKVNVTVVGLPPPPPPVEPLDPPQPEKIWHTSAGARSFKNEMRIDCSLMWILWLRTSGTGIQQNSMRAPETKQDFM